LSFETTCALSAGRNTKPTFKNSTTIRNQDFLELNLKNKGSSFKKLHEGVLFIILV